MLLEVRNLSVRYGTVSALSDISFDVPMGSVVCIIGANGAGKSTIMRSLSGLLRPETGSVMFDNKDITAMAPHRIVEAGLVQVPEGRGIFSSLTVRENLDVASTTVHDKALLRRDFEHVFELFPRLRERRTQVAGTPSGGEQQMLALGRALITHGKLLLLDEPSMGLSPVLVEETFATIRRINGEGTTILLVEQNAYKAMSIADDAYVLENGRIVLQGKASELRDNPVVKQAYLGG